MKYRNMILMILLALCGATARPMSNEPGFSLHNKSNKKILIEVQNNVGALDKVKSFFSAGQRKNKFNKIFTSMLMNL